MTDIVARLRKFDLDTFGRMHAWEAADEIWRLRRLCQDLADVQRQNEETYGRAADEIERLRAALEHIAKETEPDDLTVDYVPTSTAECARAALSAKREQTSD